MQKFDFISYCGHFVINGLKLLIGSIDKPHILYKRTISYFIMFINTVLFFTFFIWYDFYGEVIEKKNVICLRLYECSGKCFSFLPNKRHYVIKYQI